MRISGRGQHKRHRQSQRLVALRGILFDRFEIISARKMNIQNEKQNSGNLSQLSVANLIDCNGVDQNLESYIIKFTDIDLDYKHIDINSKEVKY